MAEHETMAGQVAIVTGGGTSAGRVPSIGEAIARLLAGRGVKVAVVDIDADAAQRTVATIESAGGEAAAVVADLRGEAGCAAAVAAVIERFGRIDVLINNVGFGSGGVVTGLTEEEFDKGFAINLKSATFMAKAALPVMADTGGGAVVNLSTTAVEYPTTGLTYSASKAGLEALSEHIAMQYGPDGIRSNTVRPGEVWTAMIDRTCKTNDAATARRAERARRAALPYDGDAWDVAHAVVFLASPEARWITGQTISVEGGTQLIRANPDWQSLPSYWKAKRP